MIAFGQKFRYIVHKILVIKNFYYNAHLPCYTKYTYRLLMDKNWPSGDYIFPIKLTRC